MLAIRKGTRYSTGPRTEVPLIQQRRIRKMPSRRLFCRKLGRRDRHSGLGQSSLCNSVGVIGHREHCNCCGKDLHLVGEETSERYEFIPAVMKVIEDVRLKYACDCTVKTADKPAQPIEKSTAGASVLAQVIVSKFADHLPLHRQEKIFERHGVEISRKTMGGWMAQCGGSARTSVSGGQESPVRVQGDRDRRHRREGVGSVNCTFARTGRIWPYVGDAHHPVVVYDYTATRGRDGPAKFLEGYTGYLQADAYSVYDAFFKPARGLIEVGCMMHARRYFFKALDSDQAHMGPALHLIARLYAVEDRAQGLSGEERLRIAPAVVGSGDGEAAPVSAQDPRARFCRRARPHGRCGTR